MLIEYDAFGFTSKGNLFTPVIQEEGAFDSSKYNTYRIRLDGAASSLLKWDKEIAEARKIIQLGGTILWELDFGLEKLSFPLSSPTSFLSFTVAIKQFNEIIWDNFREQTFGVILFRGNLDYETQFVWNQVHKEHFEEMQLELSFKERFFVINALAQYLHTLASKLPEEILVFAFFDAIKVKSQAEIAILLSEELFGHILLGIRSSVAKIGALRWNNGYFGEPDQCEIGVCIPDKSFWNEEICLHLEELLQEMKGTKFRMIPELKILEKWEGLDEIIYLEDFITAQGKRQLDGFIAAGGKIRGRGIRTPDLLLPKQSR